MPNFSIGLSGLKIAERSIELIGTNISNASTVGYHRQEALISASSSDDSSTSLSSGTTMTIRRLVDRLLEQQLTRQQTNSGQASEGLGLLQTLESTFGEIGSQPLSDAISTFFGDLQSLTSQPNSAALQQQVVSSAQTMTDQFRSLATFLSDMREEVLQKASDLMDQANSLSTEIASLNSEIRSMVGGGEAANLLKDRRDQAVKELAELMDITVDDRIDTAGEIRVYAWGTAIVTGATSFDLESGLTTDGELGVTIKDALNYQTDLTGGRIGALLELANTILPDIASRVDTLATEIASAVNAVQVQGVGAAGSFSQLTGVAVGSGTLSTELPSVQEGSFYVRITNTATGEVTRVKVDVDPDTDTLQGVAARLDGLDHLQAWVTDNKLTLAADSGYTFDFSPALLPSVDASAVTGSARPTVSGLYTGDENENYTFTVSGSGEVGVSDDLSVEVRNSAGELVGHYNVGQGYAAGDIFTLSNGVKFSMGTGSLNDGDTFGLEALASSDTSGFLAAAGMNTLFSGTSARTLELRTELVDQPSLLGVASGMDSNDTANLQKMASLGDQAMDALGGQTVLEYFNSIVSEVGRQVSNKEAQKESADQITLQLTNQRDELSGVDVNDESAKLLIFQRMYQAIAKFISAQNEMLQYLMQTM